ncbi:hypothetical protein [Adlercreutzia sp.]|uniref:hypothetical protein n=1 Tax=Adlercreutzia sp. TaxID=1872387 RepID=UPI003FA40D18
MSSFELGHQLGLTPSQIRQDFSCVGEFGLQGYGYNVPALRAQIASILGMDRGFTAILVGVGHMAAPAVAVDIHELGAAVVAHVQVLRHDVACRAHLLVVAHHTVAVVGALLHTHLVGDVHEGTVVFVQREQIVVTRGASAVARVLELRIALNVREHARGHVREVRCRRERTGSRGIGVPAVRLARLGHGRIRVRWLGRRGRRAGRQTGRQSEQAYRGAERELAPRVRTSALASLTRREPHESSSPLSAEGPLPFRSFAVHYPREASFRRHHPCSKVPTTPTTTYSNVEYFPVQAAFH